MNIMVYCWVYIVLELCEDANTAAFIVSLVNQTYYKFKGMFTVRVCIRQLRKPCTCLIFKIFIKKKNIADWNLESHWNFGLLLFEKNKEAKEVSKVFHHVWSSSTSSE